MVYVLCLKPSSGNILVLVMYGKIQSLTSAAFPLYSLKWLQAFKFTAIALKYKKIEAVNIKYSLLGLNIKLVWFVLRILIY